MEYCCPSPEFPVIPPNEENLKHRRKLRFLMYGEVGVIICKYLTYGFMSGLFELINLWMVYTSWATMHFCQVMVYMICCGLNLLFIGVDYSKYSSALTTLGNMCFLYIIIFSCISLYVSYRAY